MTQLAIEFEDVTVEVTTPVEAGWHLAQRWLHGPISWSSYLLRDGKRVPGNDPAVSQLIEHAKGLVAHASRPVT